jgi:hypothetical protein
MAWFTYSCSTHGEFKISLPKREKNHPCPTCGQQSGPILKATSSISVVERLDNGAMSRAVERLHNIEEIMNDRADKHSEENEE